MHKTPVLTALDHFSELKHDVLMVVAACKTGRFFSEDVADLLIPIEAMIQHIKGEFVACESTLSMTNADAVAEMLKGLEKLEETCRTIRASIESSIQH